MKKINFIFLLLLFCPIISFSQSSNFSISRYGDFLKTNQNLTAQELLSMYNAGKFKARVQNFPSNVLYLDSVYKKLSLTDYERNLLTQNGFLVTERKSAIGFINAFSDVWVKDLPVFVSTDAILNAFHRSYDLILKGTEISFLIPKLSEFLETLQNKLPELDSKYSNTPELKTMLKDVDVYLTVPRKLLNPSAQPFYSENATVVDMYMSNIESLAAVEAPVFSTKARNVDFSQFKPRGHYTDKNYPQLATYFKALMWLGKIELYLIKPNSDDWIQPSDADIQRQIIDSYLIFELVTVSGAENAFNEIEKTISAFCGEQDNVTLPQFNLVKSSVNIISANNLLDTMVVKKFQDTLSAQSFAGQRILSQILGSDPLNLNQVKPASAFLMFGQRFVIDSYVTGNVVYDKIIYDNKKITRMLPTTQDVLFALGNSSSAQILQTELNTFKYSSNLAALRYLIDSYNQDFWNNSIYNLWLNSLRTLNSPIQRTNLPEFMQTAAWWQQKMNTQLASWAELRHDNILYAKQSYSAGVITCSYPFGYVEPIPQFYSSMKNLASKTIEKFNSLSFNLESEKEYLNGFSLVMDTLLSISNKELNQTEFSEAEKKFLHSVLYFNGGSCGSVDWNGWYYQKLIYRNYKVGFTNAMDYLVADYHTAPTDENGFPIGWVKHAGTGPTNMCVVVAQIPNTGYVAFTGPVSSYYEYTTTNFLRLTDEEWQQTYLNKSARPDWVNIYLADSKGISRGSGTELITEVEKEKESPTSIPTDKIFVQNYPNPFNSQTIINFTIPSELSNSFTELTIYNINGEIVKRLLAKELPSGNYLTKWDGTNDANHIVASGIYFYNIRVKDHKVTGKMNLLK